MAETLILIAKCGPISGRWPPGRNWRVFQKPYGEKWIAYLIFGKEPLIFGNNWGFRRALILLVIMIHDHKKWVEGWRQHKMCDHLCDGSRGMDDFNYFCWVEVQSKLTYQKIASFLGCFVGTPNSCHFFWQFFEVNAQKSVERQTFQLSLSFFFPFKRW